MGRDKSKTIIKKYANRRLYNTGTSSYVTLDDLAVMVKKGEEFIVVDAKTNEDITRSVLTQIIVEEESKGGETLLPISFLRQLIAFYGHGMESLVPQYLESAMSAFTAQQEKWREYMASQKMPTSPISGFDEMARKNMAMFEEATRMFTGGFRHPGETKQSQSNHDEGDTNATRKEMDELKDQLAALKNQLDKLAK